MRTRTFPAGQRLIGWNGLHLTLPVSWEIMVKGPRHLLVESDFAPVLEIRWDTGGNDSLDDIIATARQRFADVQPDVRRICPPESFAALSANTDIAWLSWHGENHPDGLLRQCPDCGTVILCRLFHHRHGMASRIAEVLASVQCHPHPGASPLWSIQDFQLSLPPGFAFIDSTFAAGLSRLAFSGNGLYLQFCRLAPAAARLAAYSLPQLLGTQLGGPLPEDIITNSLMIYECRNKPSTSCRLLSRLRRARPFRWGRIWHDAPHNRLLTVTAESTRAIDLNIVHELCLSYEIVPPNHIETVVDQPC